MQTHAILASSYEALSSFVKWLVTAGTCTQLLHIQVQHYTRWANEQVYNVRKAIDSWLCDANINMHLFMRYGNSVLMLEHSMVQWTTQT